MPKVSTEDQYLTVLNLFTTDTADNQESLIGAMREIVDSAAFPGWISSTVHAGVDHPGTANLIQWRSGEDLQKRYEGEEFKHRTLPLFTEITTAIRLLQTQPVFTQQRDALTTAIEVSPDRDDYTVIDVYGVDESNQADLIEAVGPAREYLLQTPGYRSHTVFKGLAARGVEGLFVVVYSQWDSKAAFDAYRSTPQDAQSADRVKSEARVMSLSTASDWNSYRVIHTRSAA